MTDPVADGDELAEVRAVLRQTWPTLTADDVAELPRTRAEAARVIQQRTGATTEEVETTLSELFGMVPERHEV